MAVVRTFGERTEAECVKRVRKQLADVQVIHVEPFAEAVRECFRLAINSKADWLLTVDADVLLNSGAVASLLNQAKTLDGWQIVGIVKDKLAGRARMAGVRLYRIAALPEALPLVSNDEVRPEGSIARALGGWEKSREVVGKHDFEQFYRDLYRKGQMASIKHPGWGNLAAEWRRSRDPDLRAAYAGWAGLPLGMKEKEPL